MKLEIFSTRLTSQQHQHEAGNLQHEVGITTTSTRSWHLKNINTRLEIFSTRLASQQHHNTRLEIFSMKLTSQQHQHKARNLQHKADINTTPPFEGGPFRLHQACLESAQTLHKTEAWSTHLQAIHLCQHNGAL
jgi:hypothetical protein